MKIELSSQEIKQAIIASLAGNISLTDKETTVTFTSGRSKNDLTASVIIADKRTAVSDVEVPAFNDDDDKAAPAAPVAETTEVKAEAPAAAPSTIGSLFKTTPAA